MNILVLDIGTSLMKATLYTEEGKVILHTSIPSQVNIINDIRIEKNPNILEKEFITLLKQGDLQNHPIDLITMTASRSSITAIDRQGKSLLPFIMWQDKRNVDVCQHLSVEDERIFSLSGSWLNPIYSGSKMTWIKENLTSLYPKIYKFLTIPEYLFFKMSGSLKTDTTYASRSHLMNLKTKMWDEELLNIFGIARQHLCDIQEVGTQIGKVSNTFASISGLKSGIPIFTSGGDQQCASLSQNVLTSGDCSIVLGTGAFITTLIKELPSSLQPNLNYNIAAIEGMYLVERISITCGSAFDWICRLLYDKIDYQKLENALQKIYPKGTPTLVLPFFQGSQTNGEYHPTTASFHRISLATPKEDLILATLEGIFFDIKNSIDSLSHQIKYLYLSGGLTKSVLYNQIQADIYEKPVIVSKNPESTSLGALMVILHSLYPHKSLASIGQQVLSKEKITYLPDETKRPYYQEKLETFRKLYGQ